MFPFAPRVCSEHGGQKQVLSLSLDSIGGQEISINHPWSSAIMNAHIKFEVNLMSSLSENVQKLFNVKVRGIAVECDQNVIKTEESD